MRSTNTHAIRHKRATPGGPGRLSKYIVAGIMTVLVMALLLTSQIQVPPPAEAQTPPADLITLSLSPGTLRPTFAAATTVYHTAVHHNVTQITVAATAASGVTVEYRASGAVITDADTRTAGFQVDLTGPVTTFTVTTTRGSNTKIHYVSVERNSARLFAWTPTEDLNSLDDAGNANPQGIWSDTTTMWISDDDDDKLYAYTLNGGAQDTSKEFTLHADNGSPRGLWSDGTTIWVADNEDDHLYAYTLSGGARDTSKEFALHADNYDAAGLWSDGTTIWVGNTTNTLGRPIFAYALNGGARDTNKEFVPNLSASGLWSDGATMWVVSHISPITGNRVDAYRFDIKSDRTTGPNHGTRDADKRLTLAGPAGTTPVGIWANAAGTIWVTYPDGPKVYSYNTLPTSATSTTLSDLTINDGTKNATLRPAFASTTLSYRTSVNAFANRVTVSATASGGNTATVAYLQTNEAPLEDADLNTAGFQVDVPAGETPFYILVTAQDGTALIHEVVVERDSSEPGGWTPTKDLHNLDPVALDYPIGAWSDGTTMWMTNENSSAVAAYTLTTNARDTAKEFSLATANSKAEGLWSDGTTIWVLDNHDLKAYAYTLATGASDSTKDFALNADNNNPFDIWSDGTTAWVTDKVDRVLYAYTLADGTRNTSKEFELTGNSNSPDNRGIWSDGTTVWVGDSQLATPKLIAYTLADGTSDPDKDISLKGGTASRGLWGKGGTIWVADAAVAIFAVPTALHRVYSYRLPPSSPNDITLSSLTVSPSRVVPSFTAELRPAFSYTKTSYRVAVPNRARRVTINAVANNSATPVTYLDANGNALADANSNAPGIQINVAVEETPIIIRLASGGASLTYSVVVERDSAEIYGWTPTKDFNKLLENTPDFNSDQMRGVWGNETTLYVTAHHEPKIFAYTRATGARDASKDISTNQGTLAKANGYKAGIWSDGTTMWVLNYGYGEDGSGTKIRDGHGTIFAFNLTTGTRDTTKEFPLHLATTYAARGIWSDGTTLWVSDYKADMLFAYTLTTGARDTAKDIALHQNQSAQGIWSDGTTIWVAQWASRQFYAYTLATGAHDPDKDFHRSAGNRYPRDIWSDGMTLYVPDVIANKIFSYNSAEQPTDTLLSDYRSWVNNRQGDAATEYENTGDFTIAQGFRTGGTAGVYEIHEISIDFDRGQPDPAAMRVRIVESSSLHDVDDNAAPTGYWKGGNFPARRIGADDGTHTFTLSLTQVIGANILEANTNYFITIESTSNDSSTAAVVRMTDSHNQTGDDGWAVDNHVYVKDKRDGSGWTRKTHQARIRIAGQYHEGISIVNEPRAYESCHGNLTNNRESLPEGFESCAFATQVAVGTAGSFPSNLSGVDTTAWLPLYETIDFNIVIWPLVPAGGWVDVKYATEFPPGIYAHGSPATADVDYVEKSGTVRFLPGEIDKTVSVNIIDDRHEDSNEYMQVKLPSQETRHSSVSNYNLVRRSAFGTIYNSEESVGTQYLYIADVAVTEGEGATAEFTVSLSGPVTAPVMADYATQDVTATAGTDYTAASGTLLIPHGQTSATISVPILNDETYTGTRKFALNLSNPVNASTLRGTAYATILDDEPAPLQAHLGAIPSSHNGTSSFTFTVTFSENVSNEHLGMQNDVFTVTNGEITRAERLMGQRNHWKMTVQPDDGADLTIHLPITADCSDTGAVCTQAAPYRPLSNSFSASLTGTPLTAKFNYLGYSHNSVDPFSFELAFSENIDATLEEIKDNALTITRGSITSVTRNEEGSNLKWRVTIQPDGRNGVSINLAQATDCEAAGHICTHAGELLTASVSGYVSGPVQISVADASVSEADDAVLAFKVTLKPKFFLAEITVDYATQDGAAQAGQDYTAASGTLTFRPGHPSQTIQVPVLTDSEDEDPETMTLTLSNPTRSVLADAEATGTIEDAAPPEEETTVNAAPNGLPTVSGTPQVDQRLTADVSGITDPDGLTNPGFTYQWSAGSTDIPGATSSSYFLTGSEQGKTVQVRVSFTDDSENAESVTSIATETVAARPPSTVWKADMQVVKYTDTNVGAASADLFSNVGGAGDLAIRSLWSSIPDRDLRLAFTEGVADADNMTLHVGGLALEFPEGSSGNGSFKWTEVDVDWEDGETIAVRIDITSPSTDTEAEEPEAEEPETEEPAANTPAAGLPTISGTPQVGETLTANVASIDDADGLTTVSYRYQWLAGGADISGATGSSYLLTTTEQGQTIQLKVTFTDDADNQESLTSAETLAVAAKPNTVAAGEPTISGTPQVGQELTAGTSAISDEDGLANVSYQYQWLRDDAEIAGQTNSTYELVSADEGKTIKVRVNFNDDTGNAESLTSAATMAIAAQPAETPAVLLTASFANVPADHNGDNFTFQLDFSENVEVGYSRVRDHVFTVDGGTIANAYRQTQGSNQGWHVTVNPTGNEAVTITLPETTDCDDSGAICTGDERMLSHSTSEIVAGPPAISVSDASVQEAQGAVLEFSVTLSHASSRTVTVSYATSDGTATAGDDYTAASGSLTFNAGDTSQTVEITVLTDSDDEGQETLTITLSNPSQATLADATGAGAILNGESAAPQDDPPAEDPVVLVTATFSNMPATHDGTSFTFELDFSVNVRSGYANLRDHAFTVTGGKVDKAQRRTPGTNQYWTITVEPYGNGEISIMLPATTNCDATGAICDYDDNMLSNSPSATVAGT